MNNGGVDVEALVQQLIEMEVDETVKLQNLEAHRKDKEVVREQVKKFGLIGRFDAMGGFKSSYTPYRFIN